MNRKWKLSKTLAVIGPKPREPRYVRKDERKDPEHLAFLRTLPCAMKAHMPGASTACFGEIHAHHPTGAGLALKAPDRDAMPLCRQHHGELHGVCGAFLGWTKERLRKWQREMSQKYRPMKGATESKSSPA
jgi:hypothetical protein